MKTKQSHNIIGALALLLCLFLGFKFGQHFSNKVFEKLLTGIVTYSVGIMAVAGAWYAVLFPELIRITRQISIASAKQEIRSNTAEDQLDDTYKEITCPHKELEEIKNLQQQIAKPIIICAACLLIAILLSLFSVIIPVTIDNIHNLFSSSAHSYSLFSIFKITASCILFGLYLSIISATVLLLVPAYNLDIITDLLEKSQKTPF